MVISNKNTHLVPALHNATIASTNAQSTMKTRIHHQWHRFNNACTPKKETWRCGKTNDAPYHQHRRPVYRILLTANNDATWLNELLPATLTYLVKNHDIGDTHILQPYRLDKTHAFVAASPASHASSASAYASWWLATLKTTSDRSWHTTRDHDGGCPKKYTQVEAIIHRYGINILNHQPNDPVAASYGSNTKASANTHQHRCRQQELHELFAESGAHPMVQRCHQPSEQHMNIMDHFNLAHHSRYMLIDSPSGFTVSASIQG